MKKIKICLFFVFSFFINSATYTSVDDNFINYKIDNLFPEKSLLLSSVKFAGKAVKYVAAAICVIYALNGAKNTVESVKLLMPIGPDFKLTDLLKFPLRLLAFPFKAIDVGRCFFISGSFATCFYFLHKIGV